MSKGDYNRPNATCPVCHIRVRAKDSWTYDHATGETCHFWCRYLRKVS